jgi:hydrogenase expression/formation protein HypC
MCLAVPALVKEISGTEARVELGSVERVISLVLTPDVREGDYVLVHTGFAISVVDEKEAQDTLRLLCELVDTHPVDELFHEAGSAEASPFEPKDYKLAPGLAVDLSKLAED